VLSQRFDDMLARLTVRPIINDRRGQLKEIIDLGVTFKDIPGPIFFSSRIQPQEDICYVAAQLCWYAKGRQRLDGVETYRPKMWKRMTDSLATRQTDVDPRLDLNSNYGEYVFKEGQLDLAITRLHKDPMTRQAVILLNRPSVLISDTQDHVCTTSLQFLIRDGKLHCIATMRSNELWDGFRYDVAFFTFLMDYVRAELSAKGRTGIVLGDYIHNVGSFHCYTQDSLSIKCSSDLEGLAFVFPQLNLGEGPALVKELPHLEQLIKAMAGQPSKGLSVMCDTDSRDGWKHYHTIVNLLFHAAKRINQKDLAHGPRIL
jgi:thymidylate synthase